MRWNTRWLDDAASRRDVRRMNWHRWFAWHWVEVSVFEWRWLCFVERKHTPAYASSIRQAYYEYREIR